MKKKITPAVKRDPPTKSSIAYRLECLSCDMVNIGVAMDYYGGFAHWSTNGRALADNAMVVRNWASGIRAEVAEGGP